MYVLQGDRRLVDIWFSYDEFVGFYIQLTELQTQ